MGKPCVNAAAVSGTAFAPESRMNPKLEALDSKLLAVVFGGARKSALQAIDDPGMLDPDGRVRTFKNGNYVVYPHGYTNPNYYGAYRSFNSRGELVEESAGRRLR